MLRKGFLIVVGIVLAANAVMLAMAAFNRSGEPEASLQLTERELRLPPRGMEDTGISLRLVSDRPWDVTEDDLPLFGWFDRPKLEAIGFDCRVSPTAPDAEKHYSWPRDPGRDVYAVLEYRPEEPPAVGDARVTRDEPAARPAPAGQPPAGQPASAQSAPPEPAASLEARGGVRRPPLSDADRTRLSRLIPVDVGLDLAALRKQYPDRHRFVILQASARLMFVKSAPGRPAHLAGTLNFVMPPFIFVPKEHRALLDRLTSVPGPDENGPRTKLTHDPRYKVTVKFGRHLQPWVEGVEEIGK